ncbi:MAG TPA: DinB superfamily protein [Flavobacteriales bacterium]|jgi:uncharacterized damage-inducible protein DinB|nr:DinB family protein [Flavobacteriales bacterium]HAW21409.1 DinB superfamily protein [Flavobacteriales bacterium]
MSLSSDLNALFIRDLSRLKSELEQYRTIDDLWKKSGSISNSGGNLVLHIVGNLRHFVGHVIGSSEYQRNRKHEFEGTGLSKKELLSLIDETSTEVEYALLSLSDEKLQAPFPIEIMNRAWTNQEFLLHLYGHLNYHLGQINYHRRGL